MDHHIESVSRLLINMLKLKNRLPGTGSLFFNSLKLNELKVFCFFLKKIRIMG